jgi:hypothetical protein
LGKKSSSAPDPYTTAAAQTQSNQQTAAANATLNRVDQYTPYGSSVYTVTGQQNGVPTYRQDVTLTPDAQQELTNELKQDSALSNLGFNLGDQAQATLGKGIDTSSLPGLKGGATGGPIQSNLDFSGAPQLYGSDNFDAANQRTANAAYSQATSRLDPMYSNMQNDLDSKLANQGVVQGSEAWARDQDQLGRDRNDAYNQAIYSAQAAGNAEQHQLYGDSLSARQQGVSEAESRAQFANQAQQQGFNEAASAKSADNAARAQGLQEQTNLRDLPLNELNALRGSTQIQNPQFTSVPQSQVAGTDISGDIYKSAQMNQANSNNFMNGLFGLGSAGLSAAGSAGGFGALFSDRRLKVDVERIGTTPRLGLPVYSFAYVWDRAKRVVGVMADEVAHVLPEAVLVHSSGYRMVDYGQIG